MNTLYLVPSTIEMINHMAKCLVPGTIEMINHMARCLVPGIMYMKNPLCETSGVWYYR